MIPMPAIAALICVAIPFLGRPWAQKWQGSAGLFGHSAWMPVGMFILFVHLAMTASQTGEWPMVHVRGGLQTLALLIGLGWLGFRSRERMGAVGAILMPIVALLIVVSLIEPQRQALSQSAGLFFSMHMALIFVGLGTFALSFALSLLFLIQRRRLKRKQLDGIQNLPALDTLDRLNFRTQCFGFIALTVGMAMGFFLAINSGTTRGLSGPTFWGTVAVWVWYAIGLQSWLMGRWRGKPAALFGVVGFSGLVVIVGLAVSWLGGWHGV